MWPSQRNCGHNLFEVAAQGWRFPKVAPPTGQPWASFHNLFEVGGWRYEIVIIQKNEAREIRGIPYPAKEAMPGNEQWGAYGWSAHDWEDSWKRFEEKCTVQAVGLQRWVHETFLAFRNPSKPEFLAEWRQQFTSDIPEDPSTDLNVSPANT